MDEDNKVRRRNNSYDTYNMSNYADEMLALIRNVIKQELGGKGLGTSSSSQLASAVVEQVNADGTVNVYFPPNKESIFTKISNQTPFVLNEGDSVELMLKNGSFSNCWVCAKHGSVKQQTALKQLEETT